MYQSWLVNQPGQRITIYDIAVIIGEAHPLAFSLRICISGFEATGIFPYNNTVFNDGDFSASTITDMPKKEDYPQLIPIEQQNNARPSCQDDSNVPIPRDASSSHNNSPTTNQEKNLFEDEKHNDDNDRIENIELPTINRQIMNVADSDDIDYFEDQSRNDPFF